MESRKWPSLLNLRHLVHFPAWRAVTRRPYSLQLRDVLDEIRDWHCGIVDALVEQRASLQHTIRQSSAVAPRFVGMTEGEVDAHYDADRRELDRLTVLNLVASAEGTLKVDYFRFSETSPSASRSTGCPASDPRHFLRLNQFKYPAVWPEFFSVPVARLFQFTFRGSRMGVVESVPHFGNPHGLFAAPLY